MTEQKHKVFSLFGVKIKLRKKMGGVNPMNMVFLAIIKAGKMSLKNVQGITKR